jgi:3-dehydroquinate synthase
MQLKVIFLRIRIKTLLHGEAIAGYDFKAISLMIKKLITETEYLEIKTTIKAIFDDIVFAENDIDPILELLIHDKKMNTVLFNLP